MDYSQPQRADRLAADYVVGTMRGAARRRFEALLPAHPALRQSVRRWQDALLPMAASVPSVEPGPQVWAQLEARLFPPTPAEVAAASTLRQPRALQAPLRWWQQLRLWQGTAAFASACALALGVALMVPGDPQPPVLIVMSPQSGPATFVASVAADGRSLVLEPIGGFTLESNRALQLWALPGQGQPKSLGLVSAQQASTVVKGQLLRGTAAFALSVEPPGGSPTGLPTGPVVSVGKLRT